MIGIRTYCHIKNNALYRDGKLLFSEAPGLPLKEFLKAAYRHIGLKYPKFFKMDEISKLGFLAAEVLLQEIDTSNIPESDAGIVLANAQSTLVTDIMHQQSINNYENYYPSPSVFVYTLPNIMIGEISIKHKFRGENAFYIFEHFNADFVSDYINTLFAGEKIQACHGGWVDQSPDGYEAFVYWTERINENGGLPEHTGAQVKKLYEKI